MREAGSHRQPGSPSPLGHKPMVSEQAVWGWADSSQGWRGSGLPDKAVVTGQVLPRWESGRAGAGAARCLANTNSAETQIRQCPKKGQP